MHFSLYLSVTVTRRTDPNLRNPISKLLVPVCPVFLLQLSVGLPTTRIPHEAESRHQRDQRLYVFPCSCHTTNAAERWVTLTLSDERNKIMKDGATKSLLRSYF